MNKKNIWNVLKPFDREKKVEIYRNLFTDLWSIRQNGLVVIHAQRVHLKNVTYRIQEAGRKRVLRERRKNVHAFVSGFLCTSKDVREGTKHLSDDELHYAEVYYNPYECETFVDKEFGLPITSSDFCEMDSEDHRTPVLAIWKTPVKKENGYD